jgi:hypothetical protein
MSLAQALVNSVWTPNKGSPQRYQKDEVSKQKIGMIIRIIPISGTRPNLRNYSRKYGRIYPSNKAKRGVD